MEFYHVNRYDPPVAHLIEQLPVEQGGSAYIRATFDEQLRLHLPEVS